VEFEPSGRTVTLRTTLSVIMAVLAALALTAAVLLVVVAAFFHTAAGELAAAVESVRLAESLQVELLTHSHLPVRPAPRHDAARWRLEGQMRDVIARMQGHVSSPEEAALVRTMEQTVEAYLASARGGAATSGGEPDRQLDAAFAAVERVVTLNVAQAQAVQARAARWDRWAAVGGSLAALALVTGVAGVLLWLRRAFRPILHLSEAMRRFGTGERAARAPEAGPAELREAARTFNEMASALERQREARLAFLGGIAHDLRNPLGALKLTAAAATAGGAPPLEARARGLFERVDRQVVKLERMVSDLLDAARVEAGRLSLDLRPCDVRALVSEVVEQHRPGSPDHRIELSVPADPVPVRCDPVRIEQVLGNLVGNAIKYSPGGGRVSVDVTRDDGRVTLSVADQGLGISDEDRRHIFEPFRRGSRHEGIPGMGLGLSVARRIVEAHGGVLDVESAPGAGSTFRVRLPAV
jgi:signal transduction histidine kinase